MGTPIGTQIPGDCKETRCDGSGSTIVANDGDDIQDDGESCTDDSCSGGEAMHTAVMAREPCSEGTGVMCDGAGKCVECTGATDCASSICQAGKCVSGSCTDGTKNGDESDRDCGGSCGACEDGKTCNGPADCQGGACNGGLCCTPTTCAALGSTCGAQPDGCGGMLACDDAVKDGTETDVDCGGSSCETCQQGQRCSANSDCANSHCVDGICCNTSCTANCYACNVTGLEGTCVPATNRSDSPSCVSDAKGPLACSATAVCLGGLGHACTAHTACASGCCYKPPLATAATCAKPSNCM